MHGPTPIVGGEAVAADDLTLVNDRMAVGIAIGSTPPWGAPSGAIIDVATVERGVIGRDHIAFADFLPNSWSPWTGVRPEVETLSPGGPEAVVRVTRLWQGVEVRTTYRLADGADQINILVELTNRGTIDHRGLSSGLTLWAKGGAFFAMPGLVGANGKALDSGSTTGALADRVSAYGRDWAITLHAPYADRVGYEQKDLYRRIDLPPGGRMSLAGWLQATPSGDLAPAVRAEIARRAVPSGTVDGAIAALGGGKVTDGTVIVEKNGVAYAWARSEGGRYALSLPVGRYALYATGAGFASTDKILVEIVAGAGLKQDFATLRPPGRVSFEISDAAMHTPIPARIAVVEGEQPVVEYLGRHVFFTDLGKTGRSDVMLAPGHYAFSVSHGAGFLSAPRVERVTVQSGQDVAVRVALPRPFDPAASGWFGADLHHHADQAEAVTPIADLARSQLAAGLNPLFISDHDDMRNAAPLCAIAARAGAACLPGVELTTSWGHFNAYPIHPDGRVSIDMSQAKVATVLDEARRLGATAVQLNHPFGGGEGYINNVAAGLAPGGFDPRFDLLELNGSGETETGRAADAKTLALAWRLWSGGHRYYLTGGSDTHDVWVGMSGSVRVYAHPAGPLSADSYVAALLAGASYVTRGPLILPDRMFGTTVRRSSGSSVAAGFRLSAIAGLRSASLVVNGTVSETRSFTGLPREARADFAWPAQAGWYAVTVTDGAGAQAFSNPVWIDIVDQP